MFLNLLNSYSASQLNLTSNFYALGRGLLQIVTDYLAGSLNKSSVALLLLFLYLIVIILFVLNLFKKNDRRTKHILESIDEAFISFDKKWNFDYFNSKAVQHLNLNPNQMLGKNLFDVFPNFANTLSFRKYQHALNTNKPVRFQLKEQGRFYNVNAFPTTDGLAVYFHDISRIKRAELKLQESEYWFREMADSAPVFIWMSGLDKKCYFFNKQWLEFTGRTMEQELGDGWLKGVHQDDKQYVIDSYSNSFDTHLEFDLEYRLRRYDGEYRWVFDQATPRFNHRGKFLGYIGSCIDITERKEIEQRKDEFISIASHELKTPVTSIKAFTQLLIQKMQNNQDPTPYQYLKRVDNQIDNLTGLINDLLDVSKIEQGKLQFVKTELKLDELINRIIEDLQETRTKQELKIEKNESVLILADKERISQVLINLIDNAIKYSPGKDLIIIKSESNGKSVTVSVQDFGVGIPRDKQEQVFERFFRVNGPKSETFGGLGLGLFISAEIIKRHGGRIWVKSRVGKGSTFFFSLPLVN